MHRGVIQPRLCSERIPIRARPVQRIVVNHVSQLCRALDDLDRKSLFGMPSDMAVHQPRARVVRLEGNDQVPVCWQQGDIATGRVVGLEGCRVIVVPVAGREDVEVMA